MKPNKTDLKPVIAALEAEHESVEEAALAATEAAWAQYGKKARYIVAGQVRYADGYLDTDDVLASRVALGPFATRKQAESAGQSLAYSSSTGEQAKWGAFALHEGTPASWYQERKKARQALARAVSDDISPRELRHQHVREWMDAHPGATELPEHLQGNGWDGLDKYLAWREEHALQCPSCEGTGRINNQSGEGNDTE